MGCGGSKQEDEFTDIAAPQGNAAAKKEKADEATTKSQQPSAREGTRSRGERQITRVREHTIRKGGFTRHESTTSYQKDKWVFVDQAFAGRSTSLERDEEEVKGPISEGIEKVKTDPKTNLAITFQTSMQKWPEKKQKYTLLKRAGTKGYRPEGVTTDPQVGVRARHRVFSPHTAPRASLDDARMRRTHDTYACVSCDVCGVCVCNSLCPVDVADYGQLPGAAASGRD